MCINLLSEIYRSFIERGGVRVIELERYFDGAEDNCFYGDNMDNIYSMLSSEDCIFQLECLYSQSIIKMKGADFHECNDVLNMLMFLQEVFATALWKYKINIGARLETFAREFDRLDMPNEKFRLFLLAQDQK